MPKGYQPGQPGYKDCCNSSLCALGSECDASIDRLVECGIIAPLRINKIRVCDCCDGSVFVLCSELSKLEGLDLVARIDSDCEVGYEIVEGIVDVMCNKFNDLGVKGKTLIEQCVDFLILQKEHNNYFKFPKKNPNQYHKNKYITIWSFIYEYLKIKKNSGYDYYLLCYLDNIGVMEHGSGIRCGWLDTDSGPYKDRKYSAEFKDKIVNWASKAPDEV